MYFSLSDRKQFRPAYGKLDILTSIFPDIPHIALTKRHKNRCYSQNLIILEVRWKQLLSIVQGVPCYGREPDGTMKEKKTQNTF